MYKKISIYASAVRSTSGESLSQLIYVVHSTWYYTKTYTKTYTYTTNVYVRLSFCRNCEKLNVTMNHLAP